MAKLNCWEFKKCERQPDGEKVGDLGVCPATTEERLDGVHGGKNGGRACWVVAGSMCGGKLQGTFANKYENCKVCDFYKVVKEEEGKDYQMSIVLLSKLKPVEK
jgi:hypothetical protein